MNNDPVIELDHPLNDSSTLAWHVIADCLGVGTQTSMDLGSTLRLHDVSYRPIRLPSQWWSRDCGSLLGIFTDSAALRTVDSTSRLGDSPACEVPEPGLGPKPRTSITQDSATLVALRSDWRGQMQWFDVGRRRWRKVTQRQAVRIGHHAIELRPVLFSSTNRIRDWVAFAVKGFRLRVIATIVFVMIAAILGSVFPIVSKTLLDRVMTSGESSVLWQFVLLLGVLSFGQLVFSLAGRISTVTLLTRASTRLQAGVWNRLFTAPAKFFRRFAPGDIMHRGLSVTGLLMSVYSALLRAGMSGVTMLMSLAVLIWIDATLAFFVVILTGIRAGIATAFFVRTGRYWRESEKHRTKAIGFVVEMLQGVSKLQLAGATERAKERWEKRFQSQTAGVYYGDRLGDLQAVIDQLIEQGTMVLALLFIMSSVDHVGSSTGAPGHSVAWSMGRLLAFFTVYSTFASASTGLAKLAEEFALISAKKSLLTPLMEASEQAVREGTFSATCVPVRRHRLAEIQTGISLQGLCFRYEETNSDILHDINLTIPVGKLVAIVGPSGSGKSTLAKLLLGLESPTRGTIRVDDYFFDELDVHHFRQRTGAVLQDSCLFSGSLLENISAGRHATQDEILAAAEIAGMSPWLRKLPMGIYTLASDEAGNFSGGQRQQILLARALLRRPELLLLDEATSALDHWTQTNVMNTILNQGMTRVVIAHRLTTIRDADEIYVLDRGRIVQQGTFTRLRQQSGLFNQLIRSQS